MADNRNNDFNLGTWIGENKKYAIGFAVLILVLIVLIVVITVNGIKRKKGKTGEPTVTPTPTAVALVPVTPTPAAETPAPTLAPTATPTTAAPTATPAPTAVPTAAPTSAPTSTPVPTVTPTPEPANAVKTITAEEAYNILCKYSKEALNISKDVKSYEVSYDSSTTLINGKDCYLFTLLENDNGKQRNRGVFGISNDGSSCFVQNPEDDNFVPLPMG